MQLLAQLISCGTDCHAARRSQQQVQTGPQRFVLACSMFVLRSCEGFPYGPGFQVWCCTIGACTPYSRQALSDIGFQFPPLDPLPCFGADSASGGGGKNTPAIVASSVVGSVLLLAALAAAAALLIWRRSRARSAASTCPSGTEAHLNRVASSLSKHSHKLYALQSGNSRVCRVPSALSSSGSVRSGSACAADVNKSARDLPHVAAAGEDAPSKAQQAPLTASSAVRTGPDTSSSDMDRSAQPGGLQHESAALPLPTESSAGPHAEADVVMQRISEQDLGALRTSRARAAPPGSGISIHTSRFSTITIEAPCTMAVTGGFKAQLRTALENMASAEPPCPFAGEYLLSPNVVYGGQALVVFARDVGHGFMQYAIKCALSC